MIPVDRRWILRLARFSVVLWVACGVGARAASLTTRRLSFDLEEATGAWTLTDRTTGVAWRSNADRARFGEMTARPGGGAARTVELKPLAVSAERRGILLEFQPLSDAPARLRVRVTSQHEDDTLAFTWDADAALGVDSVRLLDEALATTARDAGAVVVPVREGLLIPADSGKAFTHRFDTYTYEGCHLAMVGVLKSGSALLAHWEDPYVEAEVRSVVTTPAEPGGQRMTVSLTLRATARTLRLTTIGAGGHVELGRRYREIAKARGWLETWDRKIRVNPERAKYLGASNYKLWSALDRSMDEAGAVEKSVRVNWTFDEAAQVAEHLKRDLQMERVLFHMGGWIRRGYDNQHPDVLPAAPECGGNAALADCARRVRDLGYLFCLHDNYQDIYRDSPSWSETVVNKNPDGSLTRGGVWAGGRAYITCASQAYELARRPGNLPAIRQLTGANSYFIDTTYASGLYECHDPNHPMTRLDDLRWKVALSDYARSVFGSFGSECGREWAVPHADFFEGLTGVSGQGYHDTGLQRKLGASVVPLFEVVYRDCIAAYGKYGYNPATAAEYVLHHAALGRPLHYHEIPPHRYWIAGEAADAVPVVPGPPLFEATGPRAFRMTYRWTVRERPSGDWRVFVHFENAEGRIVFQNDHAPQRPVSAWAAGIVESGPFELRAPEGSATYTVKVGLFDPARGLRARLDGSEVADRSHAVGRLVVSGDRVAWEPADLDRGGASHLGVFVRGDGGWSAGLHPLDRFVKNTHEVLSPLHQLTGRMTVSRHEFLDASRRVQRTVFGRGDEAYEVVVNAGTSAVAWRNRWGAAELPPGGLLVDGPQFGALLALAWGDQRFDGPTLFTLRSMDGQPLARSHRVRVFHGFGDARLRFRGVDREIPREAVLTQGDGSDR